MAELNLTINGRNFTVYCDNGQEQRVTDLAQYVDSRLRDVAKAGAAGNESHLHVLTSLMLADEIFDLREQVNRMAAETRKQSQQMPLTAQKPGVPSAARDEEAIVAAIEKLAMRIDAISNSVSAKTKKRA